MESASVLENIAELAIALAGFGGIAAGLGYRTRGDWTRDDQVRLIGLAAALACLLPIFTHSLGAQAPFQVASALFVPIPASGLLFQIRLNRRGVPPGYSILASLLNFLALLSAFVLLLAMLLGPPSEREFGLYFAAVLAMLFQPLLQFLWVGEGEGSAASTQKAAVAGAFPPSPQPLLRARQARL